MKNTINKNKNEITSPNSLDSCMRVITPSMWMIVLFITILVIGFLVWSMVGKVEVRATCLAISDGSNTTCYVESDNSYFNSITTSSKVMVDGKEYQVKEISENTINSSYLSAKDLSVTDFKNDASLYTISIDGSVNAGTYSAYIVVEEVNALTFLWN